MSRIEAAGVSDTGRVRPANEDAYLVGDSVYAVADGMGGHLAGEIASATALEPIDALDGRVYSDATDAVTALRDAVVAANDQVSQMAADEPSYRGMGTTLTATMLEGRRVHIAHVGDSRAYLLRDGDFSQLTDDHTLVQHLVDEGQITREEAATHPQRSIITRAIGVSREVDVDSMTLDLLPGDQLLLCSDGLTGVVEDEVIATELGGDRDADGTLARLVELANEAGGPDNITAILLRVVEEPSARAPAAVTAATDGNPGTVERGGDGTAASTGGQMMAVPDGDDDRNGTRPLAVREPAAAVPDDGVGEHDEATDGGRRRGLRVLAIGLGVVVVLGILAGVAWVLWAQSYFVGLSTDDDRLTIYQGLDLEIGPVELYRVVERTAVTAEEVSPWYLESLESTIPAANPNDARRIVRSAPRTGTDEAAADGDTGSDEDAATDGDAADEGGDS